MQFKDHYYNINSKVRVLEDPLTISLYRETKTDIISSEMDEETIGNASGDLRCDF